MHAVRLLHTLFDDACLSIDKRLRKILFLTTESLTRCKQLSISSLGRSLNRPAKIKHTIKSVDRLFGNITLHKKRVIFYQSIARSLLKNNKRPIILIDWSGLTPCGAFHFLSASIASKGRSLTLYDQAYSLKDYTSERTHREFLDNLKSLLPLDCKPIIITDAGFRNPWFRAVLSIGWDFIGRVRSRTQYCKENESVWMPIKSLYVQAAEKAAYIGRMLLACASPLSCHFYVMKKGNKNRIKKNLAGHKVRCSMSLKHAKGAKEPWLIVSSISPEEMSATRVMRCYGSRMQIEEMFRDIKNMRNGLGMRHCRSYNVNRLNVALLIAALAMLILWVIGMAAKQKNIHISFQSNSIKDRNVLSNFIIGWQVLIRDELIFNKAELMVALECISSTTLSGGSIC
jgi:hypothetical protein